jgi:hypothetical protein
MLKITNKEHHKKMMEEALKNGSYDELSKQLKYLHLYGGLEDPNKFVVELGYDPSGYGIIWRIWSEAKKEHEFFMNGGLIYFERDNSWSVHT